MQHNYEGLSTPQWFHPEGKIAPAGSQRVRLGETPALGAVFLPWGIVSPIHHLYYHRAKSLVKPEAMSQRFLKMTTSQSTALRKHQPSYQELFYQEK